MNTTDIASCHPTRARRLRIVQFASMAALVAGIMLAASSLPMETAALRLRAWLAEIGFWGPLAMGLIYVLGALLFVPGVALTFVAGGVFGFWGGLVTVSLASTTAAALAFLIARHLARDTVARWARSQPRFAAVYRAIEEGGWKVVALLRLVPLFPYSLGNYLFGLTPVRFWPYVFASWIFMLPGTVLYVYIGYLGGESLAAMASKNSDIDLARTLLQVAGLVAAVIGVAYVTRRARRAIADYGELAAPPSGPAEGAASAAPAAPSLVRTVVLAVAGLAVLGGGLTACIFRERLAGIFGPPHVEAQERYAGDSSGQTFDHREFDTLLRRFVNDRGLVDYRGLARESETLDRYLAALAEAPFERLGRNEKLALLINAYNAFTLRLILDHYPVASIMDIPRAERWDAVRWRIAGRTVSLNQLEHRWIRKDFVEPRVHFALVCAAMGCPKLRNEAYVGKRLEAQLEDQARYVHTHPTWFEFDSRTGLVRLTKLYDWYAEDFERVAGSILKFVARYAPEVRSALASGQTLRVEFLDYDWSLNAQRKD